MYSKAQAWRMRTVLLRSTSQNKRVLCSYAQKPISQVTQNLINLTVNLYITHSETWDCLIHSLCVIDISVIFIICWPIIKPFTYWLSVTSLLLTYHLILMFEENGKQNKSKANASLNAFSLCLIAEFCWEGCFLGLWMVKSKGKHVI